MNRSAISARWSLLLGVLLAMAFVPLRPGGVSRAQEMDPAHQHELANVNTAAELTALQPRSRGRPASP